MAKAKKNGKKEEEIETQEEVLQDEIAAPALEMTQDDIRLIEAILFASDVALDERMIAERFPEGRVSLIPDILQYLQEQYAARGVNLVRRDRRWALRTSADLGGRLQLEKEQPRKFTRSAMETMAIIAYHQPVTRAEIENIRGVATSPGALDALMEAGWIKPGKKREVPGRPVTWLTTQAFLDHFGLERLADLPGMEELKAAGLLDKRPAIEAMPTTSDLFEGAESEEDPNEVTDEDLGLSGDDDDDEDYDDNDHDTSDDLEDQDQDQDDEDDDLVDEDDADNDNDESEEDGEEEDGDEDDFDDDFDDEEEE